MTGTAGDGRARDLAALEQLLGPPELRWLVDRVRRRLGSGLVEGGSRLSGVVALRDPSAAQRAAAARLVGPPGRTSTTLRIDLTDVEKVLRGGPWPAGLADAVVALTGPVSDRAAEQARNAEGWSGAEAAFAAAIERHPGLGPWWARWCADGGLKRVVGRESAPADRHRRALALVQEATAVLTALPTAGEPLAVFARRTVGDAHGLDQGRRLSRLVVAAVRGGLIPAARDDPAAPAEEPSVRDLWARVGVVMSAVSSTVVCLGVPGAPSSACGMPLACATAQVLDSMRTARAPVVLTLDQVRSGGVPALEATTPIFACENPTVVEVAAARWLDAPPERDLAGAVLVCTQGQPSTAVVELLGTLASDGATVHYHGDFDWAGLRIAEGLRARLPSWAPWRFRAQDYVDAADAESDARSRTLADAETASPWDPLLATAMRGRGLAIEEEAVADLLVADLLDAGWGLGRDEHPAPAPQAR